MGGAGGTDATGGAPKAQAGKADGVDTVALVGRFLATASAVAGLATIVVLTGGAIVWTRYHLAHLPADQAVKEMPRTELLTIGAAGLVAFAVGGAFAVLLVFLLDRHGQAACIRTRLGLAAVWTIGLVGAVIFVEQEI